MRTTTNPKIHEESEHSFVLPNETTRTFKHSEQMPFSNLNLYTSRHCMKDSLSLCLEPWLLVNPLTRVDQAVTVTDGLFLMRGFCHQGEQS